MSKTCWAKGRKTFYKMVALDENVHLQLKKMAEEQRLQIKEMARIAIEAYAADYCNAGQNEVEKLLNESALNHIVLQLIQSLTLCETMGDVIEDCNYVLERLKLKTLSEVFLDADEIQELLNKKRITTLYGTIIGEDE